MSTLALSTISNLAGTASTSSDNVIRGCAKAWVNFNGTGTVAIRASFNVTSITDNGTGDYTVNFTTAMPDVNYSFTVNMEYSSTTFSSGVGTCGVRNGGIAAGSLRIQSGTLGGTLTDYANLSVAIFSN